MKIMEILKKAKDYIVLAIQYLGKLLGVIKSVEKGLEEDEEKKDA